MAEIFWYIYLGILGTAAIGFLIKGDKTIFGKLDFVISIITWLGLFGYVTDTPIFTPLVWKVVFVGGIIWDVAFSFIKSHDNHELEEMPKPVRYLFVIGTIIILLGPLYYGLFKYAF